MKKGKILIIDDNEALLLSLKMLLDSVFEHVEISTNPNAIPSLIRRHQPKVVLLDMNFGRGINNGNEGLYWLNEIKKMSPQVNVILFTAYADIELAVRGMKDGASDFIVKPFSNEQLIEKLKRVSNSQAQPMLASAMYWGTSPAMLRLRDMVEKVACTEANILITGENGTGKELLAKEIHHRSSRAQRQLVTLDMGAITETLFESELFGYVKGAFTDAKTDRAGKMETAEGGTLFMDEIGNLPYAQQAKLLTCLQRRSVTRIGASKETPIDIRLITATNRNLQAMVRQGEFREDLLYRINTITLHLPPLCERQEDIIPLATRFINKFSDFYNKQPLILDDHAKKALKAHHWKGNIRELEHTMERAVILEESRPEVLLADNNDTIDHCPATYNMEGQSLADMEQQLIAKTIRDCNGNLTAVAQRLDITRQTLYNKIKKYGL